MPHLIENIETTCAHKSENIYYVFFSLPRSSECSFFNAYMSYHLHGATENLHSFMMCWFYWLSNEIVNYFFRGYFRIFLDSFEFSAVRYGYSRSFVLVTSSNLLLCISNVVFIFFHKVVGFTINHSQLTVIYDFLKITNTIGLLF